MKETYNKPTVTVEEFKAVDVLTASEEQQTHRDPDQPIITPPDWND